MDRDIEHLVLLLDHKVQEKIVNKFLARELTPAQFKCSLVNSLVVVKEFIAKLIEQDLDLDNVQ